MIIFEKNVYLKYKSKQNKEIHDSKIKMYQEIKEKYNQTYLYNYQT